MVFYCSYLNSPFQNQVFFPVYTFGRAAVFLCFVQQTLRTQWSLPMKAKTIWQRQQKEPHAPPAGTAVSKSPTEAELRKRKRTISIASENGFCFVFSNDSSPLSHRCFLKIKLRTIYPPSFSPNRIWSVFCRSRSSISSSLSDS